MSNKEIERKFLFDKFPDLQEHYSGVYTQHYLHTENIEVRISSNLVSKPYHDIQYKMTVKNKGTFERDEVEINLDRERYETLLGMSDKEHNIVKEYRRYIFHEANNKTELIVSHVNSEFYYGEIEFDTIEDCMAYELNIPYVREITEEPYYRMSNYFKHINNL